MPSDQHEEIVDMLSLGFDLEALSLDDQRDAMEMSAGLFPLGTDVTVSEADAGGVPSDWVAIEGISNPRRVVLYFHGGAYVMGSRNTHRGLASRVARAAQARVLLPEYRLAPEQPFPAAVEDAVACWQWLLAEGYNAHEMAIAGDSAGGGLALATLLALKSAELPMPACAVGLSPWTDLEGTGPTAQTGAVDDPMLTVDGLRDSGLQYAPADLRNPLAAPLHGDLEGLPPLLIQVGTREILLSDSTRLAERAESAGVEVTLEIEEGLIHVWQMWPDVPEAESAIKRIGAFIKERVPVSE